MVIAIPRTALGLRLLEEAGLPVANACMDSRYPYHVLLGDDECRQRPAEIAGVLRGLQAVGLPPNNSFVMHVWLTTLDQYAADKE